MLDYFIFSIFKIKRGESNSERKQNKYGNCICNRMDAIDNLKIEDVGRPPILEF